MSPDSDLLCYTVSVRKKHEKEQHRRFRRRKYSALFLVILAVLLAFGPFAAVYYKSRDYRVTANEISQLEPRPIAIVFGAGVWPDGTPTPYLQNRLDTAVQMAQADKVQKILVSGDNSSIHYNEPAAMQRYLESQGVEADRIVQDFGGLNTYDTCYRAKSVFEVEKAYLVTQAYHLPRAVMTCRVIGVDSVGVAAISKGRDYTASYIARELASIYKAAGELMFRPEPLIKGQPEPITVLE